MRRRQRSLPGAALAIGTLLFVSPLFAQEPERPVADASRAEAASAAPSAGSADDASASPVQGLESGKLKDDRLLYTLPNYLTVEGASAAPPLTSGRKFQLVSKDCFDIAEYPFVGFQALIAQAGNSPPEFKRGVPGYLRRYGAAFADNTIGNFMTEAIFPSLLHQDPRYYQLGHGNFFHRVVYTVSRSVVTRGDSGRTEFNFSEIAGNAVAAGISNAYYPRENRTLAGNVQVWWLQIGWDTAANLLREFWPDLHRAIHHQKTE